VNRDLAGIDAAVAEQRSTSHRLPANGPALQVRVDDVVLVLEGEVIVCEGERLEGQFGQDQAFNAFRGKGPAEADYRILAPIDSVVRVFPRPVYEELCARRQSDGAATRLEGIQDRLRRETEQFRSLRNATDFLFSDHETLMDERRPYIARVRTQIWPVELEGQRAPGLWPLLPNAWFVLHHLLDMGPEDTGARFSFRQAAIWQPVLRTRGRPRIGFRLHAAWMDSAMALQISRELGNYPTRLGQVLSVDEGRRQVVLVDGQIVFNGPNLAHGRPLDPPELAGWKRSLLSLVPPIAINTFAWHEEPENATAGGATGIVSARWPVWGMRADLVESPETPGWPSPPPGLTPASGPAVLADYYARIFPGSEPLLDPLSRLRRGLRGVRRGLST